MISPRVWMVIDPAVLVLVGVQSVGFPLEHHWTVLPSPDGHNAKMNLSGVARTPVHPVGLFANWVASVADWLVSENDADEESQK